MDLHAIAAGLATLALAGPAAGSAQAPPARAHYAERYFESGGVRLRYVSRGDGLPVLLVHGFGVGADLNWVAPGVLDSLAARFRVIVPDLRGHGRSDKPHDMDAYGEHFVTDLLGLLDHLGIARVDVVGYSFGSVITLKFLVDHPERVRRAVLGGAGWHAPGRRPPGWQAAWLEGLDRAARESTSVALALQRPDVPAYPPELAAALDRNDPRALAAALRTRSRLAVSEADLRASSVPILALVGELDGEARADVAALSRVAAGVTVTVIPGANHVSAVADPLFSKSITAFLSAPARIDR